MNPPTVEPNAADREAAETYAFHFALTSEGAIRTLARGFAEHRVKAEAEVTDTRRLDWLEEAHTDAFAYGISSWTVAGADGHSLRAAIDAARGSPATPSP